MVFGIYLFILEEGMKIGIPVELGGDNRLALIPQSVELLTEIGHKVFVEKGAGKKIHFFYDQYKKAGAEIVKEHEEVFEKSDLIVKSESISKKELAFLKKDQTIMAFHHLAVADKAAIDTYIKQKNTLIGYELIENEQGELPVLYSTSEIAGQMSIQIAAEYMKIIRGGKGILLGGVPGVPPAVIVIIGAGTVGRNACLAAIGSGAQVIVLDADINKLRDVERLFQKRVITAVSNKKSIMNAMKLADVLIGSVLIKGEKSPHVVTKDMLKVMKKGSLIIDLSIDQGGCIETSKPTTPAKPSYVVDGITHYCIPNVPSCVGRTATLALNNALYPYVKELAETGLEESLKNNYHLRKGVYIYRGIPVHPVIENQFGYKVKDIDSLL